MTLSGILQGGRAFRPSARPLLDAARYQLFPGVAMTLPDAFLLAWPAFAALAAWLAGAIAGAA